MVQGGKLRKHAKFEVPILKRNGEKRQKDTDEFWDKNKRKKIYYLKIFWVLVGHQVLRLLT